MNKRIQSALISVYHKDGLDSIIPILKEQNITVYSTGGTQALLESHGMKVEAVEDLTGYPSILDGRVKTLHPKVFGGILARREPDHLGQLAKYDIPELDLVVVDLYPFEDTVAETNDEATIIEKIDIGGISLIRAAAKNFNDVVTIASKEQYQDLYNILDAQKGESTLQDRKRLALKAFQVSSHYDTAIFNYFNQEEADESHLKVSIQQREELRYGENPHQKASFYGNLDEEFEKLCGKALSYNNLVDIDSAIDIMREFKYDQVTFAILKHTNSCGIATRDNIFEAYQAALAGDPVSAFGGILIANAPIDLATAEAINKQFYEVLIAPDFNQDAFDLLSKKKKRVLLKRLHDKGQKRKIKTLLGGIIVQEADLEMEAQDAFTAVTERSPNELEMKQLEFANKVVKHL
ncbi:MAG: phosphoribosylaminoimidazolecarboxamide formyltransferase/IMP cyclohydrolase, partial [Saprospiraceae bacterium]